LEGTGHVYILPFDAAQNGRNAYLALYEHFESDSLCNRSKNEAYQTLQILHYNGEKKGFTFETFVEKHNEAYLELEQQTELVYEEMKVHNFQEKMSTPELQAAKEQV
jgi:uncharacterized protein YxeA